MKNDLTIKNISFYRPPITRNQIPEVNPLSLRDICDYLLYDETAKRRTEEIRRTISEGGDPKSLKRDKLDFVTFGGVFDYRSTDKGKLSQMGKTGLLAPSGYVVIDIDHLSQIGRNLGELRTELLRDTEIGLKLLFVSPSGDGLKLVCKTLWEFVDNDSYKSEYLSLIGYLHERYNLPYKDDKRKIEGLDLTPDITRTCFLCHDDTAVLKDDNSVFNSDEHIHTEEEIKSELRGEQTERPKFQRVQTYDSYDIGYRGNLELFKRDTLIPAIFTRISEIFPSMGFVWSGNSWNSPLKLDGSNPKSPRRDKTRILHNYPYRILEQGGETIGVIDYYMQRNGLDFRGAFNELCSICGLTPPTPPQNENNRYNYSFKMKDKEIIKNNEQGSKTGSKYENRYALPVEGGLWTELSKEPEGIKTFYRFGNERDGENLIIPKEGVTMICGLSSHNKSTLLRNLALQIVGTPDDGDVLFFTYEESLRKTKLQLLNTYIGRELSDHRKNLDVIREYARTRSLEGISLKERLNFTNKVSEFDSLLTSGKLRIYSVGDSSLELTEFLREYGQKRPIKAVFVDFIQRLSSGRKENSRTDEMRHIAEDMQDYTKETLTPIIVAAQLNRQTSSPVRMGANNIAESADLTRYAETIVCLWNSAKSEDITDSTFNEDSKEWGRLRSLGFESGTPGTIYAKITKSKEGTSGLEGVFQFYGKTGVIETNDDLPTAKTKDGRIIFDIEE